MTRGSLVLHIGKSADDLAAFVGARHRSALVQVLAQKKRIDLGRVAAQRDVLVAVRKYLRLDEVTRREQLLDPAGLAHVVQRVAEQGVRVVVEVPTGLVTGNVCSAGYGDAEVARDVL